MSISDYDEALNNANDIAYLSQMNTVDSIHLLAGILHVKQSDIVIFLNRYGINIEWLCKSVPKRIVKLKGDGVRYPPLDLNNMVDNVVELSKTLASDIKSELKLIYLVYMVFKQDFSYSTALLLDKLNFVNYQILLKRIECMIFENSKVVINQVTIE